MKYFKIISVVLTFGALAFGQVENSSHDLSSGGDVALSSNDEDRICVFCHTPHNGGANVLWNRTNPAASGDFAGLGNASLRCLSCHDGATAVNNLTANTNPSFALAMGDGSIIDDDGSGNPVLVGAGNLGTDLSNDHPVGIDYPLDADPKFNVGSTLSFAKLSNGKVECNSCHDPHDGNIGRFMIASNSGSALCLDCHDK